MITKPNVKINLGLNVLRKREDGFHDLETLFVPYFDIHDTLEIVVGDDYSRTSAAIFGKYAPEMIEQGISEDGKLMITIARKEGVDWDPLKDLTAKAYFMLAEDFKMPPVKIFLEKTSPVGAGLGGGAGCIHPNVFAISFAFTSPMVIPPTCSSLIYTPLGIS